MIARAPSLLLAIAACMMPGEDSALAQRSATAQPYRPRPAIWKIADRDTTIYLFGTIHSLPPNFRWRTRVFDRIVARADTLILESIDVPGPDSDVLNLPRRVPAPPPIIRRVSRNHRAQMARFLAGLAPNAVAALDNAPTWMAAFVVQSLDDKSDSGDADTGGPGADDWLQATFGATRRPVLGIEKSADVMASLDALPERRQRALLDAALDERPRAPAQFMAPVHAWARGDVGPGSLIALETKTGSAAILGEPLIGVRNRAWSSALAARLKKRGTVLFAAGIGHFIGAGSLIELLRARGLAVVRVQ